VDAGLWILLLKFRSHGAERFNLDVSNRYPLALISCVLESRGFADACPWDQLGCPKEDGIVDNLPEAAPTTKATPGKSMLTTTWNLGNRTMPGEKRSRWFCIHFIHRSPARLESACSGNCKWSLGTYSIFRRLDCGNNLNVYEYLHLISAHLQYIKIGVKPPIIIVPCQIVL
jgi:hypothetical protein